MLKFRSTALLLSLFWSSLSFAQNNTILDITMSPANPTTTDTITFVADLRFLSSGCEYQELYNYLAGNTVWASSHHCIGAATAICSDYDTVKVAPIATPGNYDFFLTLTAGGSPGPCTPGIVADDTATYSFTVSGPNAITTQIATPLRLNVQPNPASTSVNVGWNNDDPTNLLVIDMTGRKVLATTFRKSTKVNISTLPKGVYFVNVSDGKNERTSKLVVQ